METGGTTAGNGWIFCSAIIGTGVCALALLSAPATGAETSAVGNDRYSRCLQSASDQLRTPNNPPKTGAAPNIEEDLRWCILAEVRRRLGDYRAVEAYEKAIAFAPREPAYELLYGEYLRNVRGADTPLFQRVETHLLRAKAKLREATVTDPKLEAFVDRALIRLYEADGLPLVGVTEMPTHDSSATVRRPTLFFSTINEYARRPVDPDEVDDARNFTSEALFAESPFRLNRPLTDEEFRSIVRNKPQFDTLNRVRYRPGPETPLLGAFTAIDVFYRYRHIEDAQITNFFEPASFNDLNLNEYGIAVEKSFSLWDEADGFLRGSYSRIHREGLVEFLPDEYEDINHFEANAAFSRFVGPDKITLSGVYVYEDIDPNVSGFPERDRQIAGTTLSYLIVDPKEPAINTRLANRGIDVFGGFLFDRDSFGDVNINKWDYFAGLSFRGVGFGPKQDDGSRQTLWFNTNNAFDVTVQPTLLTSSVSNDASQDNSQYRTNVVLLWRILDEENVPGLRYQIFDDLYPAFVHLALPLRHDIAVDGPDEYENYAVGLGLSAKFFVNGPLYGPSYLASAGYMYQDYYNIDKNLHEFYVQLSMGF